MKKLINLALLCSLALPVATMAQVKKQKTATNQNSLPKLIAAVEAQPDSLSRHEAYLKAAGIENPAVVAQYEKWMRKFPKSAVVPYAIANAYLDKESPKAKPYLLKAVAIDPKFAEAWGGLWIDAQRWGDFKGGQEYLKKATEANPLDSSYAFYYSDSFRDTDEQKYREMTLAVAKRFADSERGAQALYWLAQRSNDQQYKIKIYELLKASFSPAKFNWSEGGMSSYYNLLLGADPQKAAALAQEMISLKEENRKEWAPLLDAAQNVVEAKKLIAAQKGTEALAVIAKIKIPRYFNFNTDISLLKAEAIVLTQNKAAAYDSLIIYFAKNPALKIKEGLAKYGAELNKNAAQVDADILQKLGSLSKQATPFTLKRYLTPGVTSLADYKGKVVLLTYWFPGCGPCRGEFPHFENVIRKFKGKSVDYVGINIVSEQNDYVVPFMKGSEYSFTPLEDTKDRVKGNLDNRGAAPANFLIDQQGRVIFSDFRIDEANEDQLEMMINLLLG